MNDAFLTEDKCGKLWKFKRIAGVNVFTLTCKNGIPFDCTKNNNESNVSMSMNLDAATMLKVSSYGGTVCIFLDNHQQSVVWQFHRNMCFGEHHDGIDWESPLPCPIRQLAIMMLEAVREHLESLIVEKMRQEQEEEERVEHAKQDLLSKSIENAKKLLDRESEEISSI